MPLGLDWFESFVMLNFLCFSVQMKKHTFRNVDRSWYSFQRERERERWGEREREWEKEQEQIKEALADCQEKTSWKVSLLFGYSWFAIRRLWLVCWAGQKIAVAIPNLSYVVLCPMLPPITNFTHIGWKMQKFKFLKFLTPKIFFKDLPKLNYQS